MQGDGQGTDATRLQPEPNRDMHSSRDGVACSELSNSSLELGGPEE